MRSSPRTTQRQSSPIHPGQKLCLPEVGFGRDLPSVVLDAAPVRGACRFANSWHATRGGGRLHAGVDLISPAGTPVVAAANGTLTRQTIGGTRSGNAWWLTTSTGTYFFYAHLASFAERVGGRLERAGRRRDRFCRLDRQRGGTSPAFRDPPERRRGGQSVLGDLDDRRMQLRPPVRADPAVLSGRPVVDGRGGRWEESTGWGSYWST